MGSQEVLQDVSNSRSFLPSSHILNPRFYSSKLYMSRPKEENTTYLFCECPKIDFWKDFFVWWANQRCLSQIIVLFEQRGFPQLINMNHNIILLLGIMLRYLSKAFLSFYITLHNNKGSDIKDLWISMGQHLDVSLRALSIISMVMVPHKSPWF